ncbi:SOS response-associated peptidase family protein [Methylococcus geothermalis]
MLTSGSSGEPIETCTVTDANALMRPIHDRMPLILSPRLRRPARSGFP